MPKKHSDNDARSAYTLAHSAQCRLHMSAAKRDRDFRFILGHSFLLNNTLMRVAEIEELGAIEEPEASKKALVDADEVAPTKIERRRSGLTGSLAGGKVSFDDTDSESEGKEGGSEAMTTTTRSPTSISHAPAPPRHDDEVDNDAVSHVKEDDSAIEYDEPTFSDEEPEYAEDEDDDLGLVRYPTASTEPPRMVAPSESDSDEDDGPISPPALPADFDYSTIVEQESDQELGDLYERVRSCRCQDKEGEKSKGIWNLEMPEAKDGIKSNKRFAIMQVEA